jgi:hypothetical protein
VFFLAYRTYAGIIRHSTFIDGVKLLISTTTSYFAMLVLNYSVVILCDFIPAVVPFQDYGQVFL